MSIEAFVRKLASENQSLRNDITNLHSAVAELMKKPRSITEEIDAIPGRRINYTLSGTQTFTTTQDGGVRGNAISMLVSQDGPFVMTHYPVIGWRPSLPTTATNFGRWRPVTTFPIAAQEAAATGGVSSDYIDISYEIVDGGSQRNLQNLTVTPGLINRFDNAPIAFPVPTLFAPNTSISIFITYQNIVFGGSTATTEGTLQVDLPGYRIVNL